MQERGERDEDLWVELTVAFTDWTVEQFATIPVGVRTHLRNFLRANGVYVPMIQGRTSVSQTLESVVNCPEPLEWPEWELHKMSRKGSFNS